jgi:integrase
LKQGIISLNPGETKSEEARTVYLNEELMKQIKALYTNRRLGCPYVFHRNGEVIKSFRKVWATVCIKAGLCKALKDDKGNPVVIKGKKGEEKTAMVPTKLFHDFRRTGVRNMVRAGVPERVAMMVSGHKTRSVFERYNIVSDQDLKDAARKMQTYHEKLNSEVEIEESKRGEVIPFKEAQSR